eukprot:8062798-Prorocentrum_lima.AAC.1
MGSPCVQKGYWKDGQRVFQCQVWGSRTPDLPSPTRAGALPPTPTRQTGKQSHTTHPCNLLVTQRGHRQAVE